MYRKTFRVKVRIAYQKFSCHSVLLGLYHSTDLHHHGSLFTLFLHSPLTALCYICNVGDVAIHHWERCQSYIDRFVTEASRLVTRCRMDDIEQGSGFIGERDVNFVCLELNFYIQQMHLTFNSLVTTSFGLSFFVLFSVMWRCDCIEVFAEDINVHVASHLCQLRSF